MGLETVEELITKHADIIVVCDDAERVRYINTLARVLGYNIVSWAEWAEKRVTPALIVTKDVDDIP